MRMFIGVDIDAEWKARIADAVRRLEKPAGFRWERTDNLHLTLKFLGEVPDDRAAEVMTEAGRAAGGTEAMEIGITGVGVFPDMRKPTVLWLGVDDPTGRFAALAGRLEAAMAGLGFPPEKRPFHPHLTIARLSPEARLGPALEHLRADGSLRFRQAVRSVVVFESRLGPAGSTYFRVAEHPLKRESKQGEDS